MPFAPALAVDNALRCFRNKNGAKVTACFMTITFDFTGEMKRIRLSVVLVDAMARPQLAREQDNALYHRIIIENERLTGISSVRQHWLECP